jgi:hypothetical protein
MIYAVPKDAPFSNGAILSAYCIANLPNVPCEGIERKDIDQSAWVVQFYLLEQERADLCMTLICQSYKGKAFLFVQL